MFVVGGYGPAYENDVWRSADGETWVAVSVVGDVFSGRQKSSGGCSWGQPLGDWGVGWAAVWE